MKVAAQGHGPLVMLIECNLRWSDPLVAAIAEWSTVLTVAPTGFSHGGRLGAGERYSLERFEGELLGAVDDRGTDRFSILGYSMSAAFGAWLATRSERVDTVIAGGFPIYGDYRMALDHVRDRLDRNDEEALGADPAAARVFWEHLATLERGSLARPASGRMAVFFGTDDALVDGVGGLRELRARSLEDGYAVEVIEGANHREGFERMLELTDWFRTCLRAASSSNRRR